MPTPGSDVDVLLTNNGVTTVQGLILARQPTGEAVEYQQTRLPRLPTDDLKAEQRSWHLGYGDYLYNPNDPHRYAFSDGVDLRIANQATIAPHLSFRLNFLIRNMDAETDSVAMWATDLITNTNHGGSDGGSASISRVATNVRDEGFAFEVVSGTTANSGVYQDLTNPTVYRNEDETPLNFRVYARSGAATVQAFIWSNGGGSDDITVAAHSGGGSYELLTVAGHAVHASATFVAIGVRDTAGTTTTFQIDGGWMDPNGGVTPHWMQEFEGSIYMGCGRVIAKWDGTDVFDAVVVDNAEEFKGVVVHRGYIIAAHTSGYTYSLDGSTWVDVTPSAGAADFLFQMQDENQELRLIRVDLPNAVYWSTETIPDDHSADTAIAAGDWDSQANSLEVGDPDKDITSVFGAFNTTWMGREDGLWFWYAPLGVFVSATDQFRVSQDADNFQRAIEYIDGFAYTTVARAGLLRFRYQDGNVQFSQAAPRHQAAMLKQFGGRIRAFAHDGIWLYGVMDSPDTDTSATKHVHLMAAREEGGAGLTWHTLRSFRMGDIRGAFVGQDYLWVFGRFAIDGTNFSATIYRMNLPTQTEVMAREKAPLLHNPLSGEELTSFVTGIHNFSEFGYGEDNKTFTKVIVYGADVSAARTITVHEQIDADIDDAIPMSLAGWTAVGSAIETLTNGAAVVSFTAGSGSVGKRCRLRFSLAGTGGSDPAAHTSSPFMHGYRLVAVPHPDRFYGWTLAVSLETAQLGLTGQSSSNTAQNILANLTSLDGEDFPLRFTDLDGTAYDVQIVSMDTITLPAQTGPMGPTRSEHLERAVRLTLREVLLS